MGRRTNIQPENKGTDYGYRTYASGKSYADQMRRLSYKAMSDRQAIPESEFAKPYSNIGAEYSELEYYYENTDFPEFDFLEYYPAEGLGGVVKPVATPVISPDGGTFETSATFEIKCDTPRASIRYTLDGTTPTQSHGWHYKNPVNITNGATVKAIAYFPGGSQSEIAEAKFTVWYWQYIGANAYDGYIENKASGWSNTRNAATGSSYNRIGTNMYHGSSDEGAGVYRMWRTFLEFDITAISSAYIVDEVKIAVYVTNSLIGVITKGTQNSAYTTADFDAFLGGTFYASSTPPVNDWWWFHMSSGGPSYSQAGVAYVQSVLGSSSAKFCIRDYTYDYSDVAPSAGYWCTMKTREGGYIPAMWLKLIT